MKGPKVVLIGAGSAFFGRQTIWSLVMKEALCGGTLALVDHDSEKLGWMTKIAKNCIKGKKSSLKIEASTNRKDVLKNADFVILAFANKGVELRGNDADISTKHGMTMCSADTVGPGGIMRTIREVPHQNEIMRDVEKLCPDAWVINWVNPTCAMGIAMMRNFPKIKSLAICDGPHNPRFDDTLIVNAGLVKTAEEITDELRSKVKIRSGGINHFNWLLEMTYEGRDLTPLIKEGLKKASQAEHVAASEDGKVARTNRISSQLADVIGYVPKCTWHTQEYLPYFQGHDVDKENALTIQKWNIEMRRKWMDDCRKDMQDIASGKRKTSDFLKNTSSDHASDIIESMWTGTLKKFYINVKNNGAITNLTDDAYVEVPCIVNMNAVMPLPFGPLPRPILGYVQRILDEHELAVEAAVTCSRKTLLQAFLASMVIVSIPDATNCMEEMLVSERKYLPAKWFR
jgi:alpha-galactosidase